MDTKLIKLLDIFFIIVALIIVIVFNITTILNFISGDTDSFRQFTDLSDNIISQVGTFFSENILTPNITTVLIWAGFGLLVYFFVSFLKIELQDILKVFNLHGYVQPKNARSYAFINFILELLFTFVLVISLIAWLIYSTTVLVPTSSALVLVGLYESSSLLVSVLNLSLSVFTVFIIFYFPVLFYRIVKILINYLSR